MHAFSEHVSCFISLHTAGFALLDGWTLPGDDVFYVSPVRRLIFLCIPVAGLWLIIFKQMSGFPAEFTFYVAFTALQLDAAEPGD
jgi:hypothetical protein